MMLYGELTIYPDLKTYFYRFIIYLELSSIKAINCTVNYYAYSVSILILSKFNIANIYSIRDTVTLAGGVNAIWILQNSKDLFEYKQSRSFHENLSSLPFTQLFRTLN